MNQLTILRNFATLHIKGLQHMATSEEIVQQWHNCVGIHFVTAKARHQLGRLVGRDGERDVPVQSLGEAQL
jgi:hypothetical protein